MKKTLQKLSLLMTLMVVGMTSAWGENVADVLNNAFTGITGTSYAEFSGKTSNSEAVYAGQCAGGNSAIQLRSNNNNSGVITTKSGGKVKTVAVAWNSNTNAARVLQVYVSNTAFTSPTELYGVEEGGSIVLAGELAMADGDGELEIDGDYKYVAFRSKSGALYLDEVKIKWEADNVTPTKKDATVQFAGKDYYTVFVGESFLAPEAYVYVDGEIDYDLPVTYEVSDETLAQFVEGEEGRQVLKILASGTFTVKASFAGNETYNPASATCSYKALKGAYDNIADAKADATETEVEVQMTFTDVVVTSVSGNKVYITDGAGTEGMIYQRDHGFEQGQTLNGTVICTMLNYLEKDGSFTFEFKGVTADMEGLTVTASAIATPALTVEGSTSVKLGATGELTVAYDGDGVVTVTSSDESVLTVEYDAESNVITVTPVAEGTASIIVATSKTDNYFAASTTVDVVVIDPNVVFFDLTDDTFVEASETQVLWSNEAVTIEADKADAQTKTNNYLGGVAGRTSTRFYKGSTLTIAPVAGYKIVSVSYVATTTGYAGELKGSDWENATAKVEGDNVTVTVTPVDGTKPIVATIGGTTGASSIVIKVVPADYRRELYADMFATICLPKAATVQGATVYDVAGVVKNSEDAVVAVVLAEVEGTLTAGKPYVVEGTADGFAAFYTGEAVARPVAATGLVGNLDEAAVAVPDNMYILSKNVLRQVQGGAVEIAQNRAYFDLSSVPEYEAPTAGVKVVNIFGQDATAIENLTPAISEGEGVIYNLAGQRVNTLQKGINIVGGKKVLVK